jgi:hypothetical protein
MFRWLTWNFVWQAICDSMSTALLVSKVTKGASIWAGATSAMRLLFIYRNRHHNGRGKQNLGNNGLCTYVFKMCNHGASFIQSPDALTRSAVSVCADLRPRSHLLCSSWILVAAWNRRIMMVALDEHLLYSFISTTRISEWFLFAMDYFISGPFKFHRSMYIILIHERYVCFLNRLNTVNESRKYTLNWL